MENVGPSRNIACLNVPDFYVTLEEMRKPNLKGHPVALAEPGPRSAIQGTNAVAREEGILEGLPLNYAKRLCRRLHILSPDLPFYREEHQHILESLDRFSPLVEGTLPGHYFVDLTGTRRLWGPGPDVASRMEQHLLKRMGLHSRVGLATNKLVSQVAATCVPPGDLGCIFPGGESSFLEALPVTFLPGVGLKTASHLADFNIQRIGELAALPMEAITGVFGNTGRRLLRIARGIDSTPVIPFDKALRLSMVRHLDRDEIDRNRLESFLFQLVEEAGWALRSHNRYPGRFMLELRFADGASARKQNPSPPVTVHVDQHLFHMILPVFRKLFQRRVALRRMTLELSDFSMPYRQMSLFPWEEESLDADRKVQKALDDIRRRFGRESISWGRRWPSGSEG